MLAWVSAHAYLEIQEVALMSDSSTHVPRGVLKGSIGPIFAYACWMWVAHSGDWTLLGRTEENKKKTLIQCVHIYFPRFPQYKEGLMPFNWLLTITEYRLH